MMTVHFRSPNAGYALGGLVILGMLTYWQGATSSSLFGDEWGRVSEIAYDQLACPTYDNLFMRPLVGCYISVLNAVLGNSFWAYHAVSLVWTISGAILLYLILEKVVPRYRLMNVVAAGLFLVYPANLARLFFERGSYEISLILFLTSVLIWLSWYRKPRLVPSILTTSLIVVSLLLYEVHVGLVLFLSILFYLSSREAPKRSRLLNLVPALIAVIFVFGRILTQMSEDNVHGHTTESIVLSPGVLVLRMFLAIRTLFQWAWTHQLAQLIPYRDNPGLVIVSMLAGAFIMALLALTHRRRRHPGTSLQYRERREILLVAILGVAVAIVGYVPGILAFDPGLDFLTSRINIVPSMGAAVTIAALVSYVSKLLSASSRNYQWTYLVLIAPIIGISVNAQLHAQSCTEVAWDNQKSMWRQMTGFAPDLAKDTNVVLLLTPRAGPCTGGAKPMESGPWGASGALSVLYGHDDLKAWFAYINPGPPPLIQEPSWWLDIPESRRLVFLYDWAADELSLLSDDNELLSSNCQDCISMQGETHEISPWRWLID